jgi:hypothetical protein
MKIAVALRTCDSVFSSWGSERFVDGSKATVILTCLNSILKSIKQSSHEIIFSIHDDNSSDYSLNKIEELCNSFNIKTQIFNTEKQRNFYSQYQWVKGIDCDYVYCVEDDYLHYSNALDTMVSTCDELKTFIPSEYAIYPFNNPHRYASPDMLYPSYILKRPDGYWRSSFHSTHTFFISKKSFTDYDGIMQYQADRWPALSATEDKTINNIWHKQEVKLITPLNSLAFHLADKTQEDTLSNWQQLWNDNLIN